MIKAGLNGLDMNEVRAHYDERIKTSKNLLKLFQDQDIKRFANLALGISAMQGNYSAREHNLGPRILSFTKPVTIFELAKTFMSCGDSGEMLTAIYNRQISHLKIRLASAPRSP